MVMGVSSTMLDARWSIVSHIRMSISISIEHGRSSLSYAATVRMSHATWAEPLEEEDAVTTRERIVRSR